MGKSYSGCSRKSTNQLNVLHSAPFPVAVSIWYAHITEQIGILIDGDLGI